MSATQKPSSLIKQERILPKEQPKQSKVGLIQSAKTVSEKKDSLEESRPKATKKFKNQDATIKLSRSTKEEIELLMKLKETKFAYEMIESMIDSYVANELSNDEQRSFRTLKEFILK